MQTPTDFSFEDFQKEAINGLYSRKSLFIFSILQDIYATSVKTIHT